MQRAYPQMWRDGLAEMTDGQSRVDWGDGIARRERPAVNPWRHVATRQKHFHHASWSMFGRDGHVSFHMAARADEFVAAHKNCRWGV